MHFRFCPRGTGQQSLLLEQCRSVWAPRSLLWVAACVLGFVAGFLEYPLLVVLLLQLVIVGAALRMEDMLLYYHAPEVVEDRVAAAPLAQLLGIAAAGLSWVVGRLLLMLAAVTLAMTAKPNQG